MRNILRVIGIMLIDIPSTETAFRTELESVKSSAMYASPELERFNWERLSEVVNSFIPQPPTPLKLWQQDVVDAFTGQKG
jgi:hypothetical protein